MASKSSALLLPAVLGLCLWWMKGKWQWRDAGKLIPYLMMAILAAVITAQTVQKTGIDELQWAASWQERLATAGAVFCFYLGKLLWPHPLIVFYPDWKIDAGQATSYLPLAVMIFAFFLLWHQRRTWARPWLFAFAYYLMTLLPVMGLFSMTSFRYAPVEDHLQYFASMGPLALAGAGLSHFLEMVFPRKSELRSGICGGILIVLGIVSWQRTWIFESEKALWTDTLAKNPDCWLGYNNLGLVFFKEGQLDDAISNYQKSLEINPAYSLAHFNLGLALSQKDQTENALSEYKKAVEFNPDFVDAHYNLGNGLFQKGQVDEAMAHYEKVLEINPNHFNAHNNLGLSFFEKGPGGRSDRPVPQGR